MSCKLNDVCELIVDCPHSTEPDEGDGYPIIRTPNIGVGYLDLEGVQRVSRAAYDRRNIRAVPRPNDLILAREAPAGNVGIIREGMEVCLGQRTVLIRPDAEKVSPLFLNYYLNAPKQRHALLSNSNGATVSHVNMPIIRSLVIELPDRETQDRIADVLSAYDELVENNRRQIKLLEEAAQRLYKEWFIDLKFPGHETTSIVDGLPEGWKYGILGDLLDECGTRIDVHEREAFEHYLPIDSLPSKSFTCWDSRPICEAESSLLRFKKDDFIFGAMRPYFHKVVVAPYEGITRSTCFVLCSKDAIANYFAYMSLFWEQTIRYATSISVGTTMPYVRWNDLKRMKLVIPRQSVQRSFSSLVASFFNEILVLEKHVALAREARDRLLPKLISGEIEV